MSYRHYPNRQPKKKITREHTHPAIYVADKSCDCCGRPFKGMTLGEVREHKGRHRARAALGQESDVIQIRNDVTNFQHGQMDGHYRIAVNGIIRGYLDYSQYPYPNGDPYINYIEVTPRFQHQGLARRMVEELAKEFGGYQKIHWGMLTDDGLRLKEKLDKEFEAKSQKYES